MPNSAGESCYRWTTRYRNFRSRRTGAVTELPLARHDAVQLEAALGKGFVLIGRTTQGISQPRPDRKLFNCGHPFRKDSGEPLSHHDLRRMCGDLHDGDVRP